MAAPGLRRGRLGVDAAGDKHPRAVVEGATENAPTVQALLDNLIERGLDPEGRRLFIVDGAKALTKACPSEGRGRSARPSAATRRSSAARFTRPAISSSACPRISTSQSEKRCAKPGSWTTPARLIKNLACRLEREAPGVAASILEGSDEILTVTRLGLPLELRRSLACTNIIENMNGTIRRVCGNSLPSRRRGSNAGATPAWRSDGRLPE